MQRLQEERRKDAETQKKKQQERRNRERLEARDHLSVEAPSKTDPVIKSPPLPTMRTKQVPPDNSSVSDTLFFTPQKSISSTYAELLF